MSGLSDVKLHFIESLDDVLRFKEWLGSRRPHDALAIDTETTGLKIGHDIVRLVQIGDGEHGWAAAWTPEVGVRGSFIPGWGNAIAHDLIQTWTGSILMHNAKFDVGMLEHMRVKMPRDRIVDTRIMAHIDAPHLSTGLKNVANRLVDGASSAAAEQLAGGTWTWATVPIDYVPYWTYGALDPVLTYRIFENIVQRVPLDDPAFVLENAVQWVIERMERYGAHIDVPLAQAKYAEFMRFVKETGDWVEREYHIKAGSNADVVRVLQDAGITFTKQTSGGATALDRDVLEGIDHPLAEAVLARRRLQKLASTYLRHFADEVDENDVIHPSINTLGARTSRMSMSNPNLQNLPRKNTDNPAADIVRSCVTARSGNVMMMCDFDQVEMRILAHTAREESMIEAFKAPDDFFVSLARMIYADDTIIKSDPRRQITKNAGYATIYAAGVLKFALTAGIPYDQAQRVRRRWDELFPRVARFQREVIDVATKRRLSEGLSYVKCPITGRRQIADAGKEYTLVNFLVQGAAAAIFKKKLLELDAAGLGEWMVVPVHDEIVLDVPADESEHVARTLDAIMNDDTLLSVPLSASVSHGPSWGSKEAWR